MSHQSAIMENVIQLTEAQKELIERLGVMSEHDGLQPAPSRVAALLLISPVTELTFDQIRETLQLSKSATSNAINLLLTHGKLEYITKPGDRKRYFRSKISSWKEEMKAKFSSMYNVADIFEEILKHRPDNTNDFNKNLEDIIDFIRYMHAQLPELYRNWEQSRS